MAQYPTEELEAVLRRAFVDRGQETILVDGHDLRNSFLRESLVLGTKNGWLVEAGEQNEDDVYGPGRGQWTAIVYELSDEGKTYFGLD